MRSRWIVVIRGRGTLPAGTGERAFRLAREWRSDGYDVSCVCHRMYRPRKNRKDYIVIRSWEA